MAAPQPVEWYRTALSKEDMKGLHRRSDVIGSLQSLGFLGAIALTAVSAFVAAARLPVWAVVPFIFAHGMVCSFLLNAVHELCHGTVFRTKALNAIFVRVFSFIGWINFEMFWDSHERHHRYTLHPPDDLEVVLPMRLFVRHFLLQGFVDPVGAWNTFRKTWRIAGGRMEGQWELTLYPVGRPEIRGPAVWWARFLLIGHGLILGFSIWRHIWILPILSTLAPFYGGWLFMLCNNAQHMGLRDNVTDFRLCCRTITLNPIAQFLYWHMNFHTEHHMYAAVPCYRLGRLHRLIKHDLPPCPRGLISTWREIAAIQRRQEIDPAFQCTPPLPGQSN